MKYSKQREVIFTTLQEYKVHPSAEELYSILKNKGHNIGIATIYRNLSSLAEAGEILRFKTFEKNERFDSTIAPHYHFQCKKCGKIFDLPIEITETLTKNVTDNGFEIAQCAVMLSGFCPNCKQNEGE